VTRLTIQGTVEDRILWLQVHSRIFNILEPLPSFSYYFLAFVLQETKRQLADTALGEGDLKNLSRLSLEELKYLFKGDRANEPLDP